MEFKDLAGYKTYIVAVASVCYALGGVVSGHLDIQSAITLILAALGLSGLRHGVTPMPSEEIEIEPSTSTG